MNLERRWKALIIVYMAMITFAAVFQSVPPVFPRLIPSLGISHTQAGLLMSLFALPGVIISIPGGLLADSLGARRVGAAALILMAAGSLLTGLGPDFLFVVAGRVLAGIGAMTIAIVAAQVLSAWFRQRELGAAMGIFNTAMPVGTIFAFNVFGRAAALWDWRVPILFTSVVSVLMLLLFYWQHRDPPEREAFRKLDMGGVLPSLRRMPGTIWLTGAIWGAFNVAAISFLTFASDYYVSVGFNVSYAGFLTSLFMVGSLLLSPIVGYLIDKVGREEMFIAGGCLALSLLLLLIPHLTFNPLVHGILIGLTAAFIPAPVFSLVSKIMSPAQLGLGYGILSTCLNTGVLLGPFLVGLSVDRTNSYVYGFYLMAAFALTTTFIALFLRFLRHRKPDTA